MSTRAVTSAAPAAASFEEQETQFLPTDTKYRMTGEMPAESGDEKTPASETGKEETHESNAGEAGEEHAEREAAGDDKTAAASEAASTQTKPKTAATSENRYAKLARENRELREKNARLEGRVEGASSTQKPREVQQETRPAAESGPKAEPKIDDVDAKTGKPKFTTLAEYQTAREEWLEDKITRKFEQKSATSQREQQQAQHEQSIASTVKERADAARKAYSDYDDVVTGVLEVKDEHGNEAFFLGKGTAVEAFLLDSDRGHEVMYTMAKNPDAYKHIFARDAKGEHYLLSAVRQLRELAKIENSLPAKKDDKSSTTTSSAKPVTQAPRPPHQVSGKGTVSKDAIEQAVEDVDSETYIREMNSRVLAKRKKG